MFNRSKKYIILLLLNIIVVVVWYTKQEDPDLGIFDTDYVINLLDQKDKLENSVTQLQNTLTQINADIDLARIEVDQLQVQAINAEQRFNQCQDERKELIGRMEKVT